MGAMDFYEEIVTNDRPSSGNVQDAYQRGRNWALDQYGHDPYNGTISTTNGFQVVRTEPMELSAARRFAEQDCGNASKWDSARAVPFVEYATVESTAKTRKIVLSLSNTTQVDLDKMGDFPSPDNYVISTYGMAPYLREDETGTVVDVKVSTRKKSASTPGDAVRRYRVWVNGSPMAQAHPTVAEARKHMNAVIDLHSSENRPCRVEVRGTVERESMPELVSGGVEVTRIELTVEVTTTTKTSEVLRQGWLFYGVAAT